MPSFFDTFFSEKDIDHEEIFEVEGAWGTNLMPYGVVIESIKQTEGWERQAIETCLRTLDINNCDIKHYLRHLGKALAL